MRIAVLVVVAALVGVGLWLFLGRDSKKPHANQIVTSAIGPKALVGTGLRAQASRLATALYWVGPKKGYRYEFTRTTNGRLYVRYLPKGVGVDKKKGQLLIVATYPWSHPYAALKAVSNGRGVSGQDGSFVIPARPRDSKSVLVAWPNGAYEVEVYSPVAGKAASIAESGKLSTVG